MTNAINRSLPGQSVADSALAIDECCGGTADFDLLVDDLRADSVYDLLRGVRLSGCRQVHQSISSTIVFEPWRWAGEGLPRS